MHAHASPSWSPFLPQAELDRVDGAATGPPTDLPRLPLRLPKRARGEELIDRPDVDIQALERSMAAVTGVNERLGGVRSVLSGLRSAAKDLKTVSLLDVGVGNGDLPRKLARELSHDGLILRWTGVDVHPVALGLARRGGEGEEGANGALVRSDALRLPFADRSFDVAAATLTLHHLAGDACVQALREMGRVSRRRVLVSDLERHPLHYLGARILAATLWRTDPLTRHDGPLSVLRGFTRRELAALAHRAGLDGVRVRRFFPFRLLLEARPSGGADGSA